MRVFVAVDLADRVRRDVAAFAVALASQFVAARLVRIGGVTWVAERHLHFTLRFVGEVDEPTGDLLAAAMAAPIDLDGFEVFCDRLGVFPGSGPPRVLWLDVAEGGAELAVVADQVERRLRQVGIPPEARPFSAHLTLARFRQPPARGLRDEIAAASRPRRFGPSRVDQVTLYESRLSPGGPSYRAIARAALGAARPRRGGRRP